VQDLRKFYEKHVERHGKPHLVVDLSGVGFAGSAALGNFVALHRLVRQNSGRTIFCNVDPTVAEVFRASKLESLFEFLPDRDAALRAINDGTPAPPAERKPSVATPSGFPNPDKAAPPLRSGLLRGRRRGNDDPQSTR
jgi:anti-anti-sigma factor